MHRFEAQERPLMPRVVLLKAPVRERSQTGSLPGRIYDRDVRWKPRQRPQGYLPQGTLRPRGSSLRRIALSARSALRGVG